MSTDTPAATNRIYPMKGVAMIRRIPMHTRVGCIELPKTSAKPYSSLAQVVACHPADARENNITLDDGPVYILTPENTNVGAGNSLILPDGTLIDAIDWSDVIGILEDVDPVLVNGSDQTPSQSPSPSSGSVESTKPNPLST